ncbi:MAG: helix-turn-helix domain-containing protein [Spirochaetales bacterium]|nr:helix-turn-helix domain-containing protein [Spirochaetales bacterium]
MRIKTMPLHTTAATAARAKMLLNRLNPGIEVKTGMNQYSSRPHIHQSWSLSIVLRGATRVSLGNWKSELVEDQFIAIPPGMPHLCSPEPLQPFGYAVLYLPLDYIDTASASFAVPRVGRDLNAASSVLFDDFLAAESDSTLASLSESLSAFLLANSSSLSHDCGNAFPDYSFPEDCRFSGRDDAGLSRFRQYRRYRRKFGIGSKRISTIQKIEQAKHLLREGIPPADVAQQCGFYDQSHFCKAFKAHTGLSPLQYLPR